MPRNKLTKDLEKIARQNGLLGETSTPCNTSARLTLPPSTNNLFITVKRRRVKSPQYRAWIEENRGEAGRLATPTAFPVRVAIEVHGKLNVRRDLDNIIKPTLDLLVSAGVLPDDNVRHVTGGRWEYHPSADEPHVVVWWEEVK